MYGDRTSGCYVSADRTKKRIKSESAVKKEVWFMERIKTLIISGKLTIEHNYRDTNERIRTLLESTGRFQVQITEEFRGATSETVSGYDLIIFDYDGKDMPTDSYQRIGEAAERTLFDFIIAGGGFMIHHSSTILDPGLPEEYYKI